MFIGEYQHNIDDKGRLTMPAKYRALLGTSFIVTRGLDGCLFVFTSEHFKEVQMKMAKLPTTNREARKFSRLILSAATEVEVDKQGRINLPKHLIDFADLLKACHIIGVGNRVEIWDSQKWNVFMDDSEEDFETIAETLIDFNVDL